LNSKFIKFLGYSPKDIWNADETDSSGDYSQTNQCDLKAKRVAKEKKSRKLSKERITILLCANIDGSERKKVDLIGK
jgi:hypothetical protein